MARKAARVDANQPELVSLLRSLGFSVKPTHMVGDGFPDLVVGKFGHNWLIEVKDGSKPPSARNLTEDEQRFHENWKGQVVILESSTDCINFSKGVTDQYGQHF